jgi:hypothetical protein
VGALVGSRDAAEARRTGVLALLQALLALGHDVLLSEPDVARAPLRARPQRARQQR